MDRKSLAVIFHSMLTSRQADLFGEACCLVISLDNLFSLHLRQCH
jgi:hypothetical protein